MKRERLREQRGREGMDGWIDGEMGGRGEVFTRRRKKILSGAESSLPPTPAVSQCHVGFQANIISRL